MARRCWGWARSSSREEARGASGGCDAAGRARSGGLFGRATGKRQCAVGDGGLSRPGARCVHHPRNRSWMRLSVPRWACQARREDAAHLCAQGRTTPHGAPSGVRSGAKRGHPFGESLRGQECQCSPGDPAGNKRSTAVSRIISMPMPKSIRSPQVSMLGSAEPGSVAYECRWAAPKALAPQPTGRSNSSERAGDAGALLATPGITVVSGCGRPATRIAAGASIVLRAAVCRA